MALIRIKQINNSPAATGGLIVFDGTNNVWSNTDNGAIQLSSGADATRPVSSTNGMIRYNTDQNCVEGYINGSWVCLFDSSIGTLASSDVITQNSHGFLQGDAVYLDSIDDTWKLAQSNNQDTLGIGLVRFIDTNNFVVIFAGLIDGLTGLSPGEYYFVSDSVFGQLTTTEPVPPNFSNPILHAISTTEGVVIPIRPSIDQELSSTAIEQGLHTIWQPAGSMIGKITGGADFSTDEIGTAQVIMPTYDFDSDINQSVQFQIAMPKSWDEGLLTFRFHWTQNQSGSGDVVWSIRAMALGDGDMIDGTWGSSVTITDTGGTLETLFISPTSNPLTVGNMPMEGDLVVFEITRNATSGSDTLAVDAKLVGVEIVHNITAANDA